MKTKTFLAFVGMRELYRDNSNTSSSVLSIYELCKTSYIDLDSRYTHDLSSIQIRILVLYATRTMGEVITVKYIEENGFLVLSKYQVKTVDRLSCIPILHLQSLKYSIH